MLRLRLLGHLAILKEVIDDHIFVFTFLLFTNSPNFSLFVVKLAALAALVVFSDLDGGDRVRFVGNFNGGLIDSVLHDGALVRDAFGVFAGAPSEILRLLTLDQLSLGC